MNLRTLLASGVLAAVICVPALASAQSCLPFQAHVGFNVSPRGAYPGAYPGAPTYYAPAVAPVAQAVPPAYYAPGGYQVPQAYSTPVAYYAPQAVPAVYSQPYQPVVNVVRRDADGDGWAHREGPFGRMAERFAHPFGRR